MKFLVVGGDDRLVHSAYLLHRGKNEVFCFAMENAQLPDGVFYTDEIIAADCVILPLPAEARLGALNAPYSKKTYAANELLGRLPEGTLVCGGKISSQLRAAAEKYGLYIFDYMANPEFTVGNAAVTAEGAVSILMNSLSRTLSGGSVLVIGYGRMGRILADRLRGLGAKVCVMSRNPEARALAKAMGIKAIAPNKDAVLNGFDAAVNTAPAPLLSPLSAFGKDCILLELASVPGFNAKEARALGMKLIEAPGLPGKYAPQTAGELIFGSVMNIVGEKGL